MARRNGGNASGVGTNMGVVEEQGWWHHGRRRGGEGVGADVGVSGVTRGCSGTGVVARECERGGSDLGGGTTTRARAWEW